MTVIGEVRDAVEAMSSLVEGTRTILAALEDGREYLKAHHPSASGDLADLLEEMRTTVAGAISATRIVTALDLTVEGSDVDRQPARFNDHLIMVSREIAEKRADVSRLRGSCTRIYGLEQALAERAESRRWWALFGDRAAQRAGELSMQMERLYSIDSDMTWRVARVLDAGEAALDAVRRELGKNGGPRPENVPAAQAVIREQAEAFAPVVDDLKTLRDRLAEEITRVDPA